MILGEELGSIQHTKQQLMSCTPTVSEHGAIEFPSIPLPLNAAIKDMFEVMATGMQLPPFLAGAYQTLVKWRPGFRRSYATIFAHVTR